MEDHSDSQQTAKDELLRLAASAEQSSDHPLSRAVLDAARRRGLVLHALAEDATVLYVGSGVQCDTGFGVVLVGNRALMDEQQVLYITCIPSLLQMPFPVPASVCSCNLPTHMIMRSNRCTSSV